MPRKMDIIPRTGDWNNGKLIDKDPARLFIPSSHSFLPGSARQWSRAPLRCTVAALFLRSAVSSFRSALSLFEKGDFRSSVFFFCAWNFCSNFCFLSSATIDDDDLTSPSARTSPNFFPYVLFFSLVTSRLAFLALQFLLFRHHLSYTREGKREQVLAQEIRRER